MRKICFVTGTRAEYGLLCRLMRLVADDPDLQLQIVATNMHLLPEYGIVYYFPDIFKSLFCFCRKWNQYSIF